jgi:hypothetical protein
MTSARANGSTGAMSLSPVLVRVVKLRNSNSIHVRGACGRTAAVKLPGSIAWQTSERRRRRLAAQERGHGAGR